MQNKILTVLIVAATAVTHGARAQDTATVVATPTSPAPAVQVQSAAPAAQAPSQVAPAPNQIIYSPRLPSPSELTSVAAAQGLSVEQIIQSASQVTVVYRYSNGQTNTVAYQLLPTGPAMTTSVVVPSAAPTVVYQTSPRVIYYDTYDPYWPRYYYPPVSLSLGFGYYHGWGGGHWGGGHWGGGHHWR